LLASNLAGPPRRGEGKLEDDIIGTQLYYRPYVTGLDGRQRLLEEFDGGRNLSGHVFSTSLSGLQVRLNNTDSQSY
jgi:hypothetical protein